MRAKPSKVMAAKIERLAQRAYDLRDSVPATDLEGWAELDRVGKRLTRLGARYLTREHTSAMEGR
jgi:hypothetical protein